jgi:DNA-binding transcriptional ArsR family regulator
MKDIHKIKNLEQVRLLSDPLKLQVLQAFAEAEKTTKQVATELGESVTKLYRHVDALHDAGLLEIASEKQKRGTIERTFRAIAERFEVDQSLFAGEAGDEGAAAIRQVLRGVEDEIIGAIGAAGSDNDGQNDDLEGILMRLRCRASRPRIDELRNMLVDWIDTAQQETDEPDVDTVEIGALIAFYPLSK